VVSKARQAARVVHDDDDIVVADKPAGLLTIGTDRERARASRDR